MSLGVTKKCFPPATVCHNCERKYRDKVTEKKERGELKRCSSCHLMTYCDQDCQKEHWNAVHKHHCRFLSGKKVVANSKHSSVSCTWCISEKDANPWEIGNVNSPKTICHIETLLEWMKMNFNSYFEFHEEGKTCGCSLKFACNLPFSLGEVSGEYIGSGIDEMLAHAIRLVNAMSCKNESEAVWESLCALVNFRGNFWSIVTIIGESGTERPLIGGTEIIPRLVKDLDKCFGPNNAWFKALRFSIDIVAHMHRLLHYNSMDLRDLEDPRFQNMKKSYQHDEPQINFFLQVSQNNLWANFKLWPTLSGGLLVIQLPEGIRCDSCDIELNGEVSVTAGQVATFPLFKPEVGSTGGLVAICSKDRNPTCSITYISKNQKMGIGMIGKQFNLYNEEWNSFLSKSRGCDVCLKNSMSSHRCSQCLASQYCSTECQIKDLNFHKTVCTDWAKDENKKMVSSRKQKKAFKEEFKSLVDQKNKI